MSTWKQYERPVGSGGIITRQLFGAFAVRRLGGYGHAVILAKLGLGLVGTESAADSKASRGRVA